MHVYRKYYQDQAIFLEENAKNLYLVLLEHLNSVNFRLFLKEEALDELTYWKQRPDACVQLKHRFYSNSLLPLDSNAIHLLLSQNLNQ